MYECKNIFRKMDYYTDRSATIHFLDVADRCTKGELYLWDTYSFHINNYKGNVFEYKFNSDVIVKREYLFAMDYLSYVLTALKRTGKEIYKITFEKIIHQFHSYLEMKGPFYSDLPVYAQTLLFIKAIDVLGSIPYQNDFFELLVKYAEWLMDDENYCFDGNHGLFHDLALLHISVLFENRSDAKKWQKHALQRTLKLFEVAYYQDFTNNENSLLYFHFNNYLYEQIIRFCNHYHIDGISKIENRLGESKEALTVFARNDKSFPLLGDGSIFYSEERNNRSCLFADIGIAIIKLNETYVSFKCKTVFQAHAHADISSITARYQNIDFLVDTGQYNYDRYSPINRFLRSSAGHSGIFPIFADGMFQKEFCNAIKYASITAYEHHGDHAYAKGEYQLNHVRVCRRIFISPNELRVQDSWTSEVPTVMRQRFIIPKELIAHSRFTASKRTLESSVGDVRFRYEITSDQAQQLTTVQFGVAAPQYNSYETTMLLDTIAENTLSGEIVAKISFWEES